MLMVLMIVLASFVYLVAGGVAWRKAEVKHRANCGGCSEYIGGSVGGYEDPQVAWFFSALAWPLLLPIVIGMNLGAPSESGYTRSQNKQLEKAKFMAQLAKVHLEESIALEKAERMNPLSLRRDYRSDHG